MAQLPQRRKSKPVLIGLGSTLTTVLILGLSGLGLNTLVKKSRLGEDAAALASRALSVQPLELLPNFQTVTPEMLNNPTNLKDFHFGNVRKGQTLTPWGWLGVYDDGPTTERKRVALTAWNGEILWTWTGFNGYGDVYDIQYDFATDLVFILRARHGTGLFAPAGNNTPNALQLDVISGRWGTERWRWRPNNTGQAQLGADQFALAAYQSLLQAKLIPANIDNDFATGETWRLKDLYRMQVVANQNKNQILLTYLPNFMQLYNGADRDKALPNLERIFTVAPQAGKMWFVRPDDPYSSRVRPLALDLKSQIRQAGGLHSDGALKVGGGDTYINLDQTYLLTNPFVTPGPSTLNYWMHLIVGTYDQNRVFHIRWSVDLGYGATSVSAGSYGTQKLAGNGVKPEETLFTIDSQSFFKRAGRWSKETILTSPALLRPAFNIFDPNRVTFAYPYMTSNLQNSNISDWPLYNVAQLKLQNRDGLVINKNGPGPNSSLNYDFGTQIWTTWTRNSNKRNLVSPYPHVAGNLAYVSPVHNFNRLVAVNPFDNSFLYSSFALLQPKDTTGNGIKPTRYRQDDQNNTFKSLWLVNPAQSNSTRKAISPLVISNADGMGPTGSISLDMTSFDHVEQDGFTFDIDGALDARFSKLYFNQRGRGRNGTYGANGWLSSKIGMLKIEQANAQGGNVINGVVGHYSDAGVVQSINNSSFGVLLHGRVDPTSWYTRTQRAFEKPLNLMAKDELLNKGSAGGTVALAQFNTSLAIPQDKDATDLVDLVSHYAASPLRTELAVVNPSIQLNNDPGGHQDVKIKTVFQLRTATLNQLQQHLGLNPGDLSWVREQVIPRATVQLYGQIGKNVKFTAMYTKLGIGSNDPGTVQVADQSPPTLFDIRNNGGSGTIAANWGKAYNNVDINGHRPLRILLQIVKPASAPSYMDHFDPAVWQPAPVDNLAQGERDFKQTWNLYQQEMLKHMPNTDLSSWGLANLIIRATFGLNPRVAQNQRIYQGPNGSRVILATNGIAYRYDDLHKPTETLIYKQDGTSYAQMATRGYGSGVLNEIKNNWLTVPTGKILMDLPLLDQATTPFGRVKGLAHPIVRRGVSFGDPNPLFRIRLAGGAPTGAKQSLILSPTQADAAELNWLKHLLTTMNFKYGMFVHLEGWINNQWMNVKSGSGPSYFTDSELLAMWNQNQFVIPTDVGQIEKVRIRLTYRAASDLGQYPNEFIMWEKQPISPNSDRLLSAEHLVTTQEAKLDLSWFNSKLTSNHLLNELDATDLQNYQIQIQNAFTTLNNDGNHTLWNKLEWEWIFADQVFSGAAANASLINAIQTKLIAFNSRDWNRGLWYLWTGAKGDTRGKRIRARLKVKAQFSSQVQLVKPNGDIITSENDRSSDIGATVKTKFDY